MKKLKSIISVSTCAAAVLAVVPFTANAADDVIYGTMNIPYADFYKAELEGAPNAYEVDAVSSATTTKWAKNGEGELFEGSYASEKNEDGSGSILGVKYPVAISQADLDALGSNNYSFTKLDSKPEAYKNVTVSDGKASFSAVQDETPVTLADASLKVNTNTAWGDYCIDVENGVSGVINGVVFETSDGNKYAFRHEENIWRGEVAWSSGIKTSEPHGNALSYENFESLMGSTITSFKYITPEGYTTVNTNTYIPVKFQSEVKVDDGKAGNGSTKLTLTGIPADFDKQYTIGEGFTVTDSSVSYTNAKPGSYTLNITDGKGKYASISGSFTLSTSDVPVKYDGTKLSSASGFTADDAANYIKNLSKVTINGTDYSASGRGAVKIIGEDGAINFDATSGRGDAAKPVFDGSGKYEITLNATGYTQPYSFNIEPAATTTSTTATAKTTAKTTTKTTAKTTAKTTSKTDSPKTGVKSAAIPTAFLAASGIAAFAFRKKED